MSDSSGAIDRDTHMTLVETVVHDALDKVLDPMRADLAEIHRAITGNGFGLEKGLVGIVKSLEESDKVLENSINALCDRIDKLEGKWDRAKWTLTGAMFGTGGLAGGLAAWLTSIIAGG